MKATMNCRSEMQLIIEYKYCNGQHSKSDENKSLFDEVTNFMTEQEKADKIKADM